MITFTIFVILAATNAEHLVKVPLGPINVTVGAGKPIPLKYEPLDRQDELASSRSLKWSSVLIQHIPVGMNGIPPLDPYHQKELPPIAITENPYASGSIYLKNLQATGLKNVVLNSLEARLKNNRYDVVLSVPVLNAEVDYEANVLAGSLLPITYNGHVSIMLQGVTVSAQAILTMKKYKGVAVYQLDGLQVTAHADQVQITIDEDVWQTLAAGSEKSTKDIFQQVVAAIERTALFVANSVLRRYPAQVLLQLLVGNAKK